MRSRVVGASREAMAFQMLRPAGSMRMTSIPAASKSRSMAAIVAGALRHRLQLDDVHAEPAVGKKERHFVPSSCFEFHAPQDLGEKRFVLQRRRHHAGHKDVVAQRVALCLQDLHLFPSTADAGVDQRVAVEHDDVRWEGTRHITPRR